MDHGQDFFSRDPEKIVCLEKLDALVDHRGAVDADLSPHGPDGMRRRLLGRNRVELFQRRAQERAARSRQNQPFHMIVIFAGKTLPERVVLAVERTDLTAAHGGGQALAHDQRRFLVGQADFLAQFHRARQPFTAATPDEAKTICSTSSDSTRRSSASSPFQSATSLGKS